MKKSSKPQNKNIKSRINIQLSMSTPIITLTTDFGLRDPYVAEMKAVILSICPNATIIDITHEVEKFNIRMGAYVLASAAPYFPKGTVHVAVVDPGVGTQRRPILTQTQHGFFVGPDNGLLVLAAKNQDIKCTREIANRKLMLPKISSTFHGRDIFAPAAAYLANGVDPTEFGSEIREIVTPKFAKITQRKDVLIGEVLHVDDFGNIITNITEKEVANINIKNMVNVELPHFKLKMRFCRAYAVIAPKEPLAMIGSRNFLEIAVNQGNAAAKFKTKTGDKIKLSIT